MLHLFVMIVYNFIQGVFHFIVAKISILNYHGSYMLPFQNKFLIVIDNL